MTKEIENAIRLIEEAGGFVMMQGILENEHIEKNQTFTEQQLMELEHQDQERLREYQQRKRIFMISLKL
jgi:hypothetical protein